jgi:hypothetical protein
VIVAVPGGIGPVYWMTVTPLGSRVTGSPLRVTVVGPVDVPVGVPFTGQLTDEETPSITSGPAGVVIVMSVADAFASARAAEPADEVLIADAAATWTSWLIGGPRVRPIAVSSPVRSTVPPGGADVAPRCSFRLIGPPPASVPVKFASNPTALESPGAAAATEANPIGTIVDNATTTRADNPRDHLVLLTGKGYST